MGGNLLFLRDRLIISQECRERFLPLEAPCAAPLRDREISLAGVSDLRGVYEIGRSAPNFHLLLYTLDGAGSLSASGFEGRLEPGALLIAPAARPYGYRLASERWRILWFHLKVRPVWAPLREAPLALRPAPLANHLETLAEGLLRETGTADGALSRAGRLYADLLDLLLRRELGLPDHEAPFAPATPDERLRALRRRVEESPAEPWTIDRMAREVCLSRAQFHREASRLFGESPMKSVARARMRRAEFLLSRAGATVAEAAAQVGYENPFAFSAAFKRLTGRSPSELRRRD
jgi:AraC-like DNA-binding protein